MEKVKSVLDAQKIDLSGGATSLIYQANVKASAGKTKITSNKVTGSLCVCLCLDSLILLYCVASQRSWEGL